MRYAQDTTVSVEKSKGEIERLLARYGATEFASGWKAERALMQFRMHDRVIRFVLPLRSNKTSRQLHQAVVAETMQRNSKRGSKVAGSAGVHWL